MRQRGFTLLELVIAMAVMAILLAIVGPDFGRYLRKASADAQSREIFAELQNARTQAAFTKRKQGVVFSSQEIQFRSYSSEGDSTGRLVSRKKLPLAINTSWGVPGSLEFDTGGVLIDPTSIKVVCIQTREDAASDAVIITPVGASLGKVINKGAPCGISNVLQK
jgi:type II secretion system protein H